MVWFTEVRVEYDIKEAEIGSSENINRQDVEGSEVTGLYFFVEEREEAENILEENINQMLQEVGYIVDVQKQAEDLVDMDWMPLAAVPPEKVPNGYNE